MQTGKHTTLRQLIQQSSLLEAKQKTLLEETLKSLSLEQEDELRKVLETEPEVITAIAKETVQTASQKDSPSFLKKLSGFFKKTLKKLQRVSEGVERHLEGLQADNLLNETV